MSRNYFSRYGAKVRSSHRNSYETFRNSRGICLVNLFIVFDNYDSPNEQRRWGALLLLAGPVHVGLDVKISCLRDISWADGRKSTTHACIYRLDMPESRLMFVTVT